MNSRTVHYDSFQKITNGIMPWLFIYNFICEYANISIY